MRSHETIGRHGPTKSYLELQTMRRLFGHNSRITIQRETVNSVNLVIILMFDHDARRLQYRNNNTLEIADTDILKEALKDGPTLGNTIISNHVPSQSNFRLDCWTSQRTAFDCQIGVKRSSAIMLKYKYGSKTSLKMGM